ncbi:MAG: LD-carboxypeptidase [Lutibacter sp.]|uniref:S66 peptidase family protein n=1 Tax=Lutibacter sp. TaxID=1925666 RepID=UPI0017F6DFF6|nr:LD-carboxypeptidase [Lutibacter sp.]MBT8317883.1 LD-carboxypeptidase [Lutibacter sp.]NNJ58741.1 LD-carboxypeptidase [Lutibacter sp.]
MPKTIHICVLKVFIFSLLTTCLTFAQPSTSNVSLIRPDYLKVGDTIAIVAPAGILKDQQPIEEAVKLVESWGLQVILGKRLFGNNFHFSGTDNERIQDFQTALDSKNVKAIWCGRGGYGTVRIIDGLDFTEFKKNPKWIIGYSDITVLHSHIHNLGYETLHAMMPVNMNIEEKKRIKTVKTFKKALFGKSLSYKIKESSFNKVGEAKGQLVGGNLSILQSLLGSVSSIDTNQKILFFEDVGEYLYHIDRMVYALKRSDYFKNCSGIIIGDMTNVKKNTTPFGQTVEKIVLEATKEYNFPILFGFPAGHDDVNKAIFLGREIEMKVGKKHSTVKFND